MRAEATSVGAASRGTSCAAGTMRIGPVETVREGDTVRVAADMSLAGKEHNVFFRTKDAPLAESTEAFAGIALVPCMATHHDCLVDRPVSAMWLAGVEGIQTALSRWQPQLSTVRLVGAVPQTPARPPATGVAAFFSGGLDSFYTVLKHLDEITHLVTMYGFDVRLDDTAMRRQVDSALREAAGALGKEMVVVETNFRSFGDAHADLHWTYGPLLAAVGHLLSPTIGRLYVPASGRRDDVDPWGSSPGVVPLWSSEALDVRLDGLDANRVRKAEFVAQNDIALRSLRVCWKNRKGLYNCGRCEKCLRTMLNLYAVGALDRCPTFPDTVNPRLLYRMRIRSQAARRYAQQNLEAIEAKGLDPRLCLALRRVAHGRSMGGKSKGDVRWLLDSILWHLGWRP